MTTEERLHQSLLEGYRTAGREIGYWGNYFLRSVKRNGGLATVKRMLRPRKAGAKPHKGFTALLDAGRLNLSVESIVLREEFQSLFTSAEIEEAHRRLNDVPAYARREAVPPEQNRPDEIVNGTDYVEGAVRSVVVNAYERDLKARAACLRRYGYRCAVCQMSFEEVYGAIGRRFIHVHHKKPLAGRRGEYTVNPRSDLIPVCPNCHAMLHTAAPPLGIDELREVFEERRKAPKRNMTSYPTSTESPASQIPSSLDTCG